MGTATVEILTAEEVREERDRILSELGMSVEAPPASDYDCRGGSGSGPKYSRPVRVAGSDPYELDADGDGRACEWS